MPITENPYSTEVTRDYITSTQEHTWDEGYKAGKADTIPAAEEYRNLRMQISEVLKHSWKDTDFQDVIAVDIILIIKDWLKKGR